MNKNYPPMNVQLQNKVPCFGKKAKQAQNKTLIENSSLCHFFRKIFREMFPPQKNKAQIASWSRLFFQLEMPKSQLPNVDPFELSFSK